MDKLVVIMPGEVSDRLGKMAEFALSGCEYELIRNCEDVGSLKNRRILFAVELGDTGINIELYKILAKINSSAYFLENSAASVIINSSNEFYTKDTARKIILYANMAGCTFPGRPLSEATGSLKTFRSYQKKYDSELEEACLRDCRRTVEKLMSFKPDRTVNPNILILHASSYETSNTLSLWHMVKKGLTERSTCSINEIHIENGTVNDCNGCVYKTCKHYSKSSNCFYGGVMVDEVYPAILDCDIMIMLCPNYNDSVSANLSAVINRLTALFRKTKFYDKYFYAIVVSGYSGSDIIAQQLISSININKTFALPPRFALMETANDIGEIERIENIENRALAFADSIIKNTMAAK